ncbi:MAG TPA: cytochrome P450 [Streptosporangiaceae bacterium]|nr:cytochrome P450 [Streptosporangiaceae bacterium]
MEDALCPVVLDRNGSDVHGEARRLRERGPVTRIELPGGVPAWSVNTYALVKQVLGDHQRFGKDPKNWTAYVNGNIPQDWPMIGWVVMDNMTTNDDADHARLRGLLMKAFTTRRVEAMQPRIREAVTDLLDALAATDPGQVIDLKANYCKALPARLMCELFGVPEEARNEVLQGGITNIDTRITPEEAEANVAQWHVAITKLIQDKQREPADDLASALIAARQEDGSKLSESELMGTLHLLLGAGSETLMNALSHSILALLDDPALREQVTSGQISWDDVFEETLRAESPVALFPFRYARERVELGGVTIEKGDVLIISFIGAGRDPALHGQTAERFDACRADKTHISFGYGVHYCLGIRLAKLAASICLPALFDRFPDMRLAVRRGELEPQGTFIMNGHLTLPVYLTAPVTAGV